VDNLLSKQQIPVQSSRFTALLHRYFVLTSTLSRTASFRLRFSAPGNEDGARREVVAKVIQRFLRIFEIDSIIKKIKKIFKKAFAFFAINCYI